MHTTLRLVGLPGGALAVVCGIAALVVGGADTVVVGGLMTIVAGVIAIIGTAVAETRPGLAALLMIVAVLLAGLVAPGVIPALADSVVIFMAYLAGVALLLARSDRRIHRSARPCRPQLDGSPPLSERTAMNRPRIVALAAAASVSGSVYAILIRPRISRWGATDAEIGKVLPGDELESPQGLASSPPGRSRSTRRPEVVWPWLVQMGSGRAGFYTHEWVERLLFITYADGHSATRIHPEWQDLHVGDKVPYSRFNSVDVMRARPRRAA